MGSNVKYLILFELFCLNSFTSADIFLHFSAFLYCCFIATNTKKASNQAFVFYQHNAQTDTLISSSASHIIFLWPPCTHPSRKFCSITCLTVSDSYWSGTTCLLFLQAWSCCPDVAQKLKKRGKQQCELIGGLEVRAKMLFSEKLTRCRQHALAAGSLSVHTLAKGP